MTTKAELEHRVEMWRDLFEEADAEVVELEKTAKRLEEEISKWKTLHLKNIAQHSLWMSFGSFLIRYIAYRDKWDAIPTHQKGFASSAGVKKHLDRERDHYERVVDDFKRRHDNYYTNYPWP